MFCMFRTDEGHTVHINPRKVRAILEEGPDRFVLVFDAAHKIGVVGTKDDIVRRVDEGSSK